MTWLHYSQASTLERSRLLLTQFREARVDLAKGLLHVALSGDPQSPFRQEVGFARLEQAVTALQEEDSASGLRVVGPSESNLHTAFRAKVAEVGRQLAAYRAGDSIARRELDLPLYLAYHELEEDAERVSRASRNALENLASRQHQRFASILVGMLVLLGVLCVGSFQVSRRQVVAVKAFRRSEEQLSETNRFLTDLIEHSAAVVFVRDPEGRYELVNRKWEEVTGHPRERGIGRTDQELFPGSVGERGRDNDRRVLETGRPMEVEEVMGNPPDERTFLVVEFPVQAGNGRVRGVCGIATEITERKRTEAALRESEAKWRSYVENAPVGVLVADATGRHLEANRAAEEMLGYGPGELVGTSVRDLPTEASAEAAARHFADVVEKGSADSQFLLQRKDGGQVWATVRAARIAQGRFLAVLQDITARKLTEGELAREVARRRVLIETSRDGIVVVDNEGRVHEANRQFAASLGYTVEELQRLHVWDWDRSWPRERVLEAIQSLGPEGAHFETRHWRKDGSSFDVELSNSAVELGGQRLVFCVCRDITERKRAEANLRERLDLQEQLAMIVATVPGVIYSFRMSPAGRMSVPYCNPMMEEYWAIKPEVLREDFSPALARVHAADAAGLRENILESARTLKPWRGTFRVCHPQKGELWLEGHSVPRLQPDGGILWHGFVQDITERKNAEAALRASEQKYRNLFQNMAEEVHFWELVRDEAGNIRTWRLIDANRPALDSWNRRSIEEIRGKTTDEIFGPGATEHYRFVVEKIMAEGVPYSFEDYFPHLDKHFRFTSVPLGDFFITTGANITTIRKVVAALRRSEAHLRTLVNTMPDLVWLKDPQGVYLACNARFESFFGTPEAEIVGKTDYDFFDRSLADFFRANDAAAVAAGGPRMNEEEVTFASDGHRELLETIKTPMVDAEGNLVGVLGIGRNITERKRAEDVLRESLLFRREAEKIGRIGAWKVSPATDYLYWTEGVYEIVEAPLNYKPGLQEGLGFYDPESVPVLQAALTAALQEGTPFAVEAGVTTAKGRHLWTEVRGIGRVEEGGQAFVIGTFQDITERKRAAEALEASEKQHRNILEAATDGYWRTSLDGRILGANAAYCRMSGYTETELLSRRVWEVEVTEPHPDMMRDHIEGVMREGGDRFETAHRRKDGSTLPLEISLQYMPEGGGYMVAFMRDMTERKRAEARAARDTLRTEFLLEFHQCAPQMTDKELYDHVLERAVQLTGSTIGFFHQVAEDQNTIILTTWNREALQNCTAAFEQHYPLSEAGNWVECVRQQRPLIFNDYEQSPHRRGLPTGHTPVRRFMSIPVIRDGKVRVIFGVGNKATDYDNDDLAQLQVVANELHKLQSQRASQRQLRESQERFRDLVETSCDWIWALDAEGRYSYASPRVRDLLGYEPDEVLGRTPLDLLPDSEARRLQAVLDEITARRQPFSALEKVHRHKGGREVVLESSGAPVLGADGELLGYRGMDRDVTLRKQLEREREAMEAQMRQQQKLESIGTLASGVAHEINNPINGIMNYAQLIQDRLPDDSPLNEFTGEIMHETQRVATIVHNLLTFARIEKQSHSSARVADIIEAVLSLIRTVIRHDQITLEVTVPADLPSLKCRSQQIQQVIMNLMTNARDALNERYPGPHPDKVLHLGAQWVEKAGRNWIRLTVEDRGTGISPEVRERMFDPFFTTKGRNAGTGLGLSISHGIVKEHHGEWMVESEPGQFTRMHVDLPVDNGWEI